MNEVIGKEVRVSKFGWNVKWDHAFTEKRNQNIVPRIRQLPQFVGLGVRYLPWYLALRMKKKKPVMDGLKTLGLLQIYGVPLGGIGGGTIGRGFKGEFCRFQLFPGLYEHHIVKANTFIVCIRKNGHTIHQQVLSPRRPKKTLPSWNWGFPPEDAEYVGLYPCSWTTYRLKELDVTLVCKQISPVIPHNYKDSSLPVGVFEWEIINDSEDDIEVSVAFTFKNGTGSHKDNKGGRWNEAFHISDESNTKHIKGVMMHQKIRGVNCVVGIAGIDLESVETSCLTSFDPKGTGKEVWNDLWEDGLFDETSGSSPKTQRGEEIACAVASKVKVLANGVSHLVFSLSWDMPKFSFAASPDMVFVRRYTRWFGSEGNAVPKLSLYALNSFKDWEEQINSWQGPILSNESLPDWYKSAIFNEMYYVADGGSVWIENTIVEDSAPVYPGDVRSEYGKFAYLEGHEYRMFNTYDVHFYASFCLIKLWPKLQLSIQYDIADCVLSVNPESVRFLMSGNIHPRKVLNSVPHDIGDPYECPWKHINAYNVHDTAVWRDLNLKFVLQVYRDYIFTKDDNYLKSMWPVVQALMKKCLTWDTDGDGVIENSGFADQTYDTWVMTGSSAYCGGLWLAALFVSLNMALHLGHTDDANQLSEVLEKGKKSFHEKLWTGKYYKFDNSTNYWSDSIMADQLCGHWYLRACGHHYEVFPKGNVHEALKTIFQLNVKGFKQGTMGAVNSVRKNGKLDRCTIQSEEVWTGVTYALSSLMIYEGFLQEGFSTSEGLYESIFNQLGLAYQTPEALHPEKHYRSLGYMRPLSIWAIQCALEAV